MVIIVPSPPPPPPPMVQGCEYQIEIEPRTYKCVTQQEYAAMKVERRADEGSLFTVISIFVVTMFIIVLLFGILI